MGLVYALNWICYSRKKIPHLILPQCTLLYMALFTDLIQIAWPKRVSYVEKKLSKIEKTQKIGLLILTRLLAKLWNQRMIHRAGQPFGRHLKIVYLHWKKLPLPAILLFLIMICNRKNIVGYQSRAIRGHREKSWNMHFACEVVASHSSKIANQWPLLGKIWWKM